MRLKNKVTIITGAAGGMGMQFGRAFLEEGARVLVTDMTAEMVDAAVAELDSPGSVIGAVVDVCRRSSIEAAVVKAADTFGRLDILVNVAGGGLG